MTLSFPDEEKCQPMAGRVNQPLARLSRAQCHLHRLRNLLGLQTLVHMPAHNLA